MSRTFLLVVVGALVAPVVAIPMASAQERPLAAQSAERPHANPFVPPLPPMPKLPETQGAKDGGNEELVYQAIAYVGTINGNDVFRFKHGKCYLEARGGRFVDSQCYRAASRWVRDNPDKR